MRKTKKAIKALGVASILVGVSTLTLTYGIQNGSISIYEDGTSAQTNISVCLGDPSNCTPPPPPPPPPPVDPENPGQPENPANPGNPPVTPPGSRPNEDDQQTEDDPGATPGTNTPPGSNNSGGSPITNIGSSNSNSGSGNTPWFISLLSPLSGFFASAISAIKKVPPSVAYFFPYVLFLLLILLMIRFLWQAAREAIAAHRAYEFLNRQQLVSEEKDTFLSLSSHYLLTPLTVMRSGIDAMISLKEMDEQQLLPMTTALDKLHDGIKDMLKDIESNTALKGIPPPAKELTVDSSLKSPFFVLPVLSVGLLVLCTNMLLGIVAQIDLNTINLLIQTAVFALLSVLLYSSLRSRHLRDVEQRRAKQLLEYEAAIDSARNAFIVQATYVLSTSLDEVIELKKNLPPSPSLRFFDEGYRRFSDILNKFKLLSTIQTGIASELNEVNLKASVEEALNNYSQQINEKGLSVVNEVHDIEIKQNQALFGFVLASVLDNAVKFSKQGGEVIITTSEKHGKVNIEVRDKGIGMPAEKLPHLFKPFSRIGSTMQFDYEGLGFSLFLDKIIMDYAGGEISAESKIDKGTLIDVTV